MYYIINDVETSGLSYKYSDVISCGLVVLNADFDIIDKFYEECCPWDVNTFNEETVGIHGMSLAYLMRQQSSRSLCINILHFLGKYRDQSKIIYRPFIYHAQNRLDFRFMDILFYKNELEFSFRKMFNRQQSYSTIRMARNFGYDENGLSAWGSRLGKVFEHHNALDDALMCANVLKFLMSKGASLDSGFEITKAEIEDQKKSKLKIKEEEEICNSSMLSFSLD